MEAVRATKAALAAFREFLLLHRAEERATRLETETGAAVRARIAAARARLRVERDLGPSDAVPALVLLRDAIAMFVDARRLDDPTLLEPRESLVLELPEARRDEVRSALARLDDADVLALDRLSGGDATRLRATLHELVGAVDGVMEERSPRTVRAVRFLRLVGFMLLVLFVARAWVRSRNHDVAQFATVRASSRYPGTPDARQLVDGDDHALGGHTIVENDPRITFELRSRYPIRTVRIHARTDCCADESLPLVVEVGDEGDKDAPFTAVRREHFDTWEIDVGGRVASTVKIHREAAGYIALSEVEIVRD